MSDKNILEYWPLKDSPARLGQELALEWLAKQDKKYLILQAPVGSGKSLIGMTYSRWKSKDIGDSYILTPQKILQHQYEESFSEHDLASLYGKGNYKCEKNACSCEQGAMINKGPCGGCPWASARNKAIDAGNVVFNYRLALLHYASGEVFNKRQTIICDEAHQLEQQLCDFDYVSISRALAIAFKASWPKKLEGTKQIQDWMTQEIVPPLSERVKLLAKQVEEIKEQGTPSKHDIKTIKEYDELNMLFSDLANIASISSDELDTSHVIIFNAMEIAFKRIKGDYTFNRIMDDKADQFLFMSSTIIDPKSFCEDIGIPEDEMAYLDIDSEFPIENRPVVFIPTMNMNASWNNSERKSEREDMLAGIESVITNFHLGESGIIHTANFKIAEWLVGQLNSMSSIPHDIIHHNQDSEFNRDEAIKQFLKQSDSEPTILISPSSTEGLDLVEDLGRFAIFAKVPYGYLGDQWIKRRMEMSNEWYQRQALIAVIQGCGRIVRSKEDKGVVYILDSNWGRLMSNASHKIPQWWKDGYQTI